VTVTTLKKWALLVPTTIVPLLYLVGYFYQEGYLSAFGLDNSFFLLSLPEYMMRTFYLTLSLVSYLFSELNNNFHYLYYAALGLALLGLFMTWFHPHQPKVTRAVQYYLRQQRFKMIWIPASMGLLGIIGFYVLLFVIGLMVLLPAGAYAYGDKQAQQKIAGFNSCQELKSLPNNLRCVAISDNRDQQRGMLIARSDTHIAIWTGEHSKLIETEGKELVVTQGTAESLTDNSSASNP